ncbi:glutathione S-transferase family protein [Paraburkholderia caribensis]|uniref:glutathione S-transferase family protein n=1 Tax=Paraburkholderia caribensis TaxID=75105 RepID=UPI001CAD9C64|nr:glutathione S-transferase N-terminal domain-containing protein [Paraburkholderia caribensis]CAG9243817.1 Disulfide-bond oxidoreductase YfcG [Paraburkholderia caribensis]
MIEFFFCNTANPSKVALFLEEAGLEYTGIPVDTRKGEQFSPDYIAINPNSKLPAIVDDGVTVFDSNAILLYLAEKTGKFLPEYTQKNRAELLSWLMFVATGLGPFSGQNTHFKHYAPERVPYALKRYQFEAERHFKVLDQRLAEHPYILGETYTIVDMCAWGWARVLPFIVGDDGWEKFPNVTRLVDEINSHPAARIALDKLKSHSFKTDIDEETRKNMYRFLHTATP